MLPIADTLSSQVMAAVKVNSKKVVAERKTAANLTAEQAAGLAYAQVPPCN